MATASIARSKPSRNWLMADHSGQFGPASHGHRGAEKSGLIRVDFSGFKVTESHTSTTSVFLRRDFDFQSFNRGSRPVASAPSKQLPVGTSHTPNHLRKAGGEAA
jgi:hypothetical protein